MLKTLPESQLLHDLLERGAGIAPDAVALAYQSESLNYAALNLSVRSFALGLTALGCRRADRVGIWLEKRFETVIASFGAPAAGGVMVPMNPLLKPEQIVYIARDCSVRVLVTSPERLALLAPVLD